MSRKLFALVVLALFLYISFPLITPVAMGAVLAILLFPLLEKFERKKIPTALGSVFLTFGVTALLIVPMAMLIFFVAKFGAQQLQSMKETPKTGLTWVETVVSGPLVQKVMKWVTEWFPITQQQFIDNAQDLFRSIALKLGDLLGAGLGKLPGLVMALAVIIVSIYFFLVDGRRLVQFIRKNSFFTAPETDQLIFTMGGICRSVILASLASGAVQAIFETIVCAILSVPNPLLIGSLVFMFSLVPLIGSAPVTFGVAAHQFFSGNTTIGLILLLSAIVVSSLDNFVRPLVLRGTANLHPLLAFIAAFGGLQMIGFFGVFLGPIVAAMFVVTIQILVNNGQKKS